jgi:VanZ family protein
MVAAFFGPQNPSSRNSFDTLIRKAAHVIEYFVLGLLLFRMFRGRTTLLWTWRWSFFGVIVVALWAASDELHQSFVSTRTASAADVAIDTAGGILAQCVAFLWHRGRKK